MSYVICPMSCRVVLYYITLYYIILIILHYITLHYITLHYITLHYITLHYIMQICLDCPMPIRISCFVFVTFYFSLFQEFTIYFHLNNLGISTENIQTQISSKRLLTQLQNFKVMTTGTKQKR